MTRKFIKSDYRLYHSRRILTVRNCAIVTALILFIGLVIFMGTWQRKTETKAVEVSISSSDLPIRVHPQTGLATAE